MERITPETAALTALTPQGDPVALGTLWQERPAMLFLVRHFGCQFCREQIADLKPIVQDLEAAGVQPVVIGNGTPLMAEAFVEETGLAVPLYTNPGREVYAALGAKRPSILVNLHPRMWWHYLRTALRGHWPGRLQGDAAQLGGVFLVRPDGTMPYAYRSDLAGDHPSAEELVHVARAI